MMNWNAHKRLGIGEFKPGQQEAIERLIMGEDILAVFPTGFGKSAIYETAGLTRGGTTLVIEPLIALELDQVAKLQEKGVKALCLHSGLKAKERAAVLESLATGEIEILYLSAEQLQNKEILSVLHQVDISLVAVDEAHVITKYGHGFREAYLEIGDFIRSLKSCPPIGAFTATATPEMKGEIKKSLGLRHPTEFIGGVTRKNLELRVCEVGSDLKSPSEKAVIELRKRELILKELEEVDKGRVIIYCNTVNKVKKLHHFLRNKGIRAGKYHGRGMSFQKKRKALKKFVKGKLDVMVATSAFGLGVDIPDVRLVIHHSPPVGLDDYVQEAGRAGRDGKKSACLLLWHNSDFHINRGLIQKTKNSISGAALKQKMASLDALGAYAREDRTCRWQQIRSFFGEDEGKRCKKRCDNCRNR